MNNVIQFPTEEERAIRKSMGTSAMLLKHADSFIFDKLDSQSGTGSLDWLHQREMLKEERAKRNENVPFKCSDERCGTSYDDNGKIEVCSIYDTQTGGTFSDKEIKEIMADLFGDFFKPTSKDK